jgi:Mg-chelatase subunit ChlD
MKKNHFSIGLAILCTVLAAAVVSGCAGSAASHEKPSSESGKQAESVKEESSGEADDSAIPAPAPAESGKAAEKRKETAPEPGLKAGTEETDGGTAGDIEFMEYEEPEARVSGGAPPSASGLQAGFADDNKQYGYFTGFLSEYASVPHLPLDVSERIVLRALDAAGKPMPNAEVVIEGRGRLLERGRTLADGSYLFFPSQYPSSHTSFDVRITAQQQTLQRALRREGERNIPISFETSRYVPEPIPLDILFIMDTTGSMGEEITRLKTTIELIHLNLTNLSVKPRVRFGMVLYKDIGDEYRTKTIPLTADLEEFQASLALVEASGGGDTPEDLQAALEESITAVQWDPEAVKMSFIITDAPPHLDYGQEYTYINAAEDAKSRGIKIFSVGTGGLDINGEYILRQISQYTSGKYIFLTYGETGESEGGTAGSVSHHTGSNFQTDKLEAIIIRFAKEELSYLTDEPIETGESYFTARKIDTEEREETLNKLFSMALDQLIDYATLKIDTGTPTALIPVIAAEEQFNIDAEYFTERLLRQTISHSSFRVVERRDIQSILDELKLQLSGLTDNTQAVKVGELMHADLLLTGTLYRRGEEFEVFIKLLRVESGEVLSLTKAKIDRDLGLSPL